MTEQEYDLAMLSERTKSEMELGRKMAQQNAEKFARAEAMRLLSEKQQLEAKVAAEAEKEATTQFAIEDHKANAELRRKSR